MRRPRFTCVSEGKPLRRLLMISKAWLVVVDVLIHDAPPFLPKRVVATGKTHDETNGSGALPFPLLGS